MFIISPSNVDHLTNCKYTSHPLVVVWVLFLFVYLILGSHLVASSSVLAAEPMSKLCTRQPWGDNQAKILVLLLSSSDCFVCDNKLSYSEQEQVHFKLIFSPPHSSFPSFSLRTTPPSGMFAIPVPFGNKKLKTEANALL